MANPLLDEINLTTLPEINDAAIEDNFFLGSVLQAHLRAKCLVPFTGGAFTRNLFLYNPLNGGAYPKGQGNFNLNKPQTLGGTTFLPCYYYVSIVEYLEDLEVLNTGDLAVFSLLETDVANAYQTASVIVALDLQQNGQFGSRSGININGWPEALNDGVNPSWDSNVYTTYGQTLRGGNIRKALNGNVYWAGQSNGATGSLTFAVLNAAYNLCRRGKDEPDLGVGNKPVVSFIENKIQPQQRFGQDSASVRDPYYGAVGFRFKNAIIMQDDYFPSALGYPYSDPTNGGMGNNLTGTIPYIAPATPSGNFPTTNQTLTVGEVFCWFNTSRIKFRISNSAEFGFTPTDFIRTPDTTRVVSQLKGACNLEFTAPWTACQLFGIGQ